MRFTKPIIVANLENRQITDQQSRILQESSNEYISSQDLFKISIDGAKDAEFEDKSIASVVLEEVTETSLLLNVKFSDPSAITSDIRSADTLIIEFLLVDLIVDAESKLPLDIDNPIFYLEVGV